MGLFGFGKKKHGRKEGGEKPFVPESEVNPAAFEKEASEAFSDNDYEKAFVSFRKAADIYKEKGEHKLSALCFVSAASCWSLKSEEKTFYNSAQSFENAAREAEESGDLEYAALLYKHAGINYERDGEIRRFSDCSYLSKECSRKFLTYSFFSPGRIRPITESGYGPGAGSVLKRFFPWVLLTFSWAIWGHGERPVRSFLSVVVIVLASGVLYSMGKLVSDGQVFRPDILDALYFSVVTFTTVGYGDMVPVGFSKLVAMAEVFSGVFIMPLFVIALTRRYLRI